MRKPGPAPRDIVQEASHERAAVLGWVAWGALPGRGWVQGIRTALNLQRAVLLVQGVPPQVHHASGRGGDPERGRKKKKISCMFFPTKKKKRRNERQT